MLVAYLRCHDVVIKYMLYSNKPATHINTTHPSQHNVSPILFLNPFFSKFSFCFLVSQILREVDKAQIFYYIISELPQPTAISEYLLQFKSSLA